ncbi:MAG: hypothetical protein NTZ17_09765 [Phycisphaerae bacterium]|nr:hypothetical protein [Phycisphaerae bacterium]
MKRLVSVLTVFVLVSAPTIAGIWTLIVPQYQARGEIRVGRIIPRLVFQTEDNGVIPFYDSFVNTQVSLLTSSRVLERVLDRPEVRTTQWFKNPATTLLQRWRGDVVPPVERLKDGLSVQARPQTEIIDVSFTALSPADAKLIVNTVLDRYMQYVGEYSNAAEERLYRQLVEQYNALQSQIQGGEKTYTDLCAALGTDTPQALVSARRLRLDEAEARLTELRRRIKVLTSDVNQVSALDRTNVQSRPAAGPGQLPPEHELARARYEEKLLSEEYQTEQAQFNELFERAQLLEKESRDLQHKRELFDAIRQRKEQKDIERNVPGCIEILASAEVDRRPCNDHRIACTAIALALGLGGAGGAAILTRKKKLH